MLSGSLLSYLKKKEYQPKQTLVVIRCTTRCHSLSIVVPLVVTRCHSLYQSLSLVVTRYTTRLSFYKRSKARGSLGSLMFSEKVFLKNFVKLKGKHQCEILNLKKSKTCNFYGKQTSTSRQVFPWDSCQISLNIFLQIFR